MIPQQTLRLEYLNSTIDLEQLGFCCIFLGGSAAHRVTVEQVVQSGSDWDGLGIVNSREDLLNLMTRHKSQLLQLLKVDYIDGSPETWNHAVRNLDWDVISISGWTRDGSNRAMKIWSRNHLETIMQDKSTRAIGVLAHKFPRNIQSNHPIHGSGLLISQAIRLTDDVSLRFEDDFITIPHVVGKKLQYSTSPALMCDLLLASREVYESIPGLGSTLKARTLSKWLVKSDETSVESLLPQLYRWESFPGHFREYLISTYSAMKLRHEFHRSNEKHDKICISSKAPFNSSKGGYRAILFEPLRKEQYKPVQHPQALSQRFAVNLILKGQYAIEHWPIRPSEALAFRNTLNRATLLINGEKQKHHVLETQMDCFVLELAALPFLYAYFPAERLQKLVAIDPDQHKAFYSYQGGSRLLDIRIQFTRMDTFSDAQLKLKEPYRLERWLLSIQTCVAQDIMSTYQASWLSQNFTCKNAPTRRLVQPHPLYKTLVQPSWVETGTPLAALAAENQISVNELLCLPISVNGVCYGSLQDQLDRAKHLLDPTAPHFENAPTVFGLGGHSGNVLVDDRVGKGTMPGLKYINYSQAGFYSPLVDMASFLYVDCFLPVLFADLCTTSLCKDYSTCNGMQLQWNIDKKGIAIDCELEMSLLDRSLAAAKLEYIVRPVFNILDIQKEDTMNSRVREQVLGHGMLVSALMTRNLSLRPGVFLLNLATGMRLAKDPREVFSKEFAWENWR
ncbi:hypothetical protein PENARI_c011G06555 [Penicillium arizonense]|uniref:Uncharacterized protein n=1 Tax=Penicillium arizonense TaxID=1835702 RepID=A0A1F5LG70_PENAI|nr:hypothetical protein PENARI_c011G06555 [Penicillium arizonense]OGE52208.1 hypothetical protein PENARI_c011G06555 [Penicillium arizonense]